MLLVPFGNVYFEGWSFDLTKEPYPLWSIAVVLVALSVAVVFASILKRLRAASTTSGQDVRRVIIPGVWASTFMVTFALCEAIFAITTLSLAWYQTVRYFIIVALAVSLVSLGLAAIIFSRRLKDDQLRREWQQLMRKA